MRNHPRRPSELTDVDLPWDLTDPERSEIRLSRMREDLLAQPDHRARAIEVTTQVARAQSLQGRLVDAERTIEQAERMLGSVPDLAPRFRALLERGRLLVLRRTPVEAGSRFLEAWLLALTSSQTFFAIDAAQMMSVIDAPKKQTQWTVRALELAEAAADPRVRAWCGHLYHELGVHFEELMQLERAREFHEKAVTAFRLTPNPRAECMARCSTARILRLTNHAEDALAIQHDVRIALHQMGVEEGVVFEEIAECLVALERNEDAEAHFRRAHALLSADEWLTNDQPARIRRLKTLGKVKQA